MTIADLAAKYERLGSSGYARACDAAATATRAAIEGQLSSHQRTGNAASSLRVVPGAGGVEVNAVRYQKYIKGVAQGDALRSLVVENYNAAVRAELGA